MSTITDIAGNTIMLFLPSLVGATLIALTHLLTPRFHFMRTQNNPWVPASAGIALAYVFMDIFPHLAKGQEKLLHIAEGNIYGFLTHNVYLAGLAGFTIYLGIILLAMSIRQKQSTTGITFKSTPVSIKLECASLAAYSFLIGYLLSEQVTHLPEPIILFGLAMAIHFAGLNYLVRDHFPILYDQSLRYIYAASVYAGWFIGIVAEISDATLALCYSFLAGGIIVVAAVYELPHIRSPQQYGAFVAGAVVFSILILASDYIEA